MVRDPQPEDAIFVRDAGHIHRADFLDAHAVIGAHPLVRRVLVALLVWPWRIDHDNAIWPVSRQRRRFLPNLFRLLRDLQPPIDAVHAPVSSICSNSLPNFWGSAS